MREIKFRAWSEKNKEMFFGKDVEYWHDGSSLQGRVMPLKADRYDVSPVLMQYTGLKDKNGKEIYEGDVVNFARKETWCKGKDCEVQVLPDTFCPRCGTKTEEVDFITTAKVVFHKCGFAYEFDPKQDYLTIWRFAAAEIFIEWVEIIGNIYETPELVQK